MDYIYKLLKQNRDEEYGQFQSRLIPTIDPSTVMGVRTPILQKMAKELKNNEIAEEFLNELPHAYFEENQLHGFIISEITDFQDCITKLEALLPYIDNWATCDQILPKTFVKHKEELLPYINKWLTFEHTYTVRFAIGMLMKHFLDEDFKPEYLEQVARIKSREYYINMEIAWYMATALAKQWSATIPYIEGCRLDRWVHNKTIQKARESYRITYEQKEYLNTLRLMK